MERWKEINLITTEGFPYGKNITGISQVSIIWFQGSKMPQNDKLADT